MVITGTEVMSSNVSPKTLQRSNIEYTLVQENVLKGN